jgi:peroxiredoxin
MTIAVGARLPDATLVTLGPDGPKEVDLNAYISGRKVVIFGLPGAFTGPCSTIHMPSFVKTADAFRDAGIDEIICIAVNDPFVLKAWSESTGADKAGITLLGDASGELTEALGMAFTAPHIGLYRRSNRYALVVDEGVVTVANVDEPNTCKVSVGEELLDAMGEAA